ncbi:MAG: hypothetical protein QG561_198 [Patescibacteria group bacterium]|jgi:hypothetical protein|nr:hypothetical protein [Patescibacteria group bacterium]
MGTVSMGTTRNSDLLIPSIARLLRITPTQTNNSASDTPTQSSSSQADMPIHTVAEPITSYICPTIKELYNPDDN